MSKLWVLMSDITGMPVEVQKCEFRPTIGKLNCSWIRVWRDSELSEVEQLEAQIKGHQEAMRPLLQKWDELRRK